MASVKAEIGKALLADVAHSGKYDLATFRRQLDGAVLAREINDAERNKRLDQLPPPVHSVARDVFYDYALAESFDSWFCNASTRSTMQASGAFWRTGTAFAAILDLLSEVTVANVNKGEPSAGLALFGRYHTGSIIGNIIARREDGYGVLQGNGPIRRGLGFEPAPRWEGNFGGGESLQVEPSSQVASSQCGTTKQIAYTAPQSYANGADYNGGKYQQQTNGSYGWVPAGSPANFQPRYFQTYSGSAWQASGSLAPTAQEAAAGATARPASTSFETAAATAPQLAPDPYLLAQADQDPFATGGLQETVGDVGFSSDSSEVLALRGTAE